MSFLDVKEEIIKIDLTEKGKELYINGKFKPYYYSFSDKDIVYNNNVETYTGSIAGLKNRISFTPRTFTKNNNNCILGNSELSNNNKPSFFVRVLNGQIISGSIERTYLDDLTTNVFQFNIETEDKFDYDILSMETNASILLDITELNSIFEKENYEISLSKLNEDDTETELSFISKELFNNINTVAFYNDSSDEIGIIEGFPVVTNTTVEYYFQILVDKQIIEDYYFSNNITSEDAEENIDREIVNC